MVQQLDRWQRLSGDGDGGEQDDGRARTDDYLLSGNGYGSIEIPVGNSRGKKGERVPPVSHWITAGLVLLTVLVLAVQPYLWGLVFRSDGRVNRPIVIGTATVKTYEGLQLSNGVSAFLGMRYAAPPLGNLRWRAPAEPVRSDPGTVEKATTYPPICLGIGVPYPAEGQSEDCLFVNVWAPTNATVTSKLPVWVFIQGGGYVANTNANWNGAEAVERSGHNIIMVNFNYRVGLWGFLASERVREDGALNAGLLDQRMLLKWVKEHIAAFGGDPNHVVIHGASAGAGSVAMQLLTYGGRNDRLFVGAMAEAIFFPAQPLVSELEYQFNRIVNQTGCGSVSSARQMECLRSRDTAVLQAANYAQPFPGRSEPPMPLFYFTPCVDGDFLRDLPYKLFENGQFIRVPMVLGTSTDEGSLFAPNAATQSDMAIFLQNNYPLLTENDTTAILSHYPQLPPLPAHNPWFPTASKAYGEATFICPQHNVQTYLDITANSRNATNRLYTYRYNVLDSENLAAGLGVPHLFDAAAIFGPDALPAARASYKTYNAGVVPLLMGYWLSFVRTLDPNRHRMPGSPVWEAWDHRSTKRLVIETVGARMDGGDDGEKERCRFWLGLGRGRMRQRRSV